MIAFYNHQVGPVLMVITDSDQGMPKSFDLRGDIARVFRTDTGHTLAWNFFNYALDGAQGQVTVSESLLADLNQRISQAGFEEILQPDTQPKLVVAEILEAKDHPDSDHLHVCQVDVGLKTPVQIVAGAPNTRVGTKTVAALPGTMMPDGRLIWPSQLRGVDSYGMLCSARELALPNGPQARGIIELEEKEEAGQAFESSMWRN